MSLPPQADWAYDYKPASGSKEEQTFKWLVKNHNWLSND
jgi:coproporphyrinogen III oxidase